MQKLRILFVLFIALILASCEVIIEADIPQHEIKPVVNCLFSPSRPFKVHVSLSIQPTDTATYSIENAQVVIKGEDGSVTTLKSIGNGYYSKKTFSPKIGEKYTLKVKVPDFDEVVAIGSIPDNGLEIKKIESKSGKKTQTVEGLGEDAIVSVQFITINFSHNIQVPDFMGVTVVHNSMRHGIINDSVFHVEDKTKFDFGFLESNDPSIKNEGLDNYFEFRVLLFRDLLFNNPKASVKFNLEKRTDSKYWIRFFRFSPEAFKYLKSWIIHYYTQEYDFWEVYEPQMLYSNIENGYGIFAGYSEQTFETYPDSTTTY